MSNATPVRHAYSLSDFSRAEVEQLLSRAEALRGVRDGDQLRGRALVQLYLAPSLRTRTSMELAAKQLGAHCITLEADKLWQLASGDGVVMDGAAAEHIREAAPVLARYGDVLAIRAFPSRTSWDDDRHDPVLTAFREHSPVPLINLESTLYHPCQALADLLTIQREVGAGSRPGKVVLSWAPHPKCLPVAVPNSFALAITQMGWDLTVARPPGYDLPDEVKSQARAFAEASGATLEITEDQDAALDGAQFVYAKSWGRLDRYGLEDQELAERKANSLTDWRIDSAKLDRGDGAKFMHCLPIRRNVVATDDVLDSSRSIVVDQAENRLHVQKALLATLLEA